MDANKSVTVDTGEGSINVATETRLLTEIKASFVGDTILFLFKSWAKEKGQTAVFSFENEGKVGFHGFTLLTVAGAHYLCKTTGLDGHPTAERALQQLQACDRVAAQ